MNLDILVNIITLIFQFFIPGEYFYGSEGWDLDLKSYLTGIASRGWVIKIGGGRNVIWTHQYLGVGKDKQPMRVAYQTNSQTGYSVI